MAFTLPTELKNKTVWVDRIFYAAWFLLALSVACYVLFFAKSVVRQREINAVDVKIAIYGSAEQKGHEKKVFDYKKKIDDFAKILGNHAISSQVFVFIERVTLPSVWFSNFSMSGSDNQITLSGETETLEILSRQVDVFEKNNDYIAGVNVVNSQVTPAGRIIFTLNLSLNPKIFNYQ